MQGSGDKHVNSKNVFACGKDNALHKTATNMLDIINGNAATLRENTGLNTAWRPQDLRY